MHGFDVGDLERRLVRAEISAAAIPWADCKVACQTARKRNPESAPNRDPHRRLRSGRPRSPWRGPARDAQCPHKRRSGARGEALWTPGGDPRWARSVGSGAVFEAPALVDGFENVAVMGQAIEQRRRHLGVAEYARPFGEGEICRQDDRGALVKAADQVEQHLPAADREWQVTQLVEDDEIDADELIGEAPGFSGTRFGLELIDQVDCGEEPNARAVAHAIGADRYRYMALAGAGAADQRGGSKRAQSATGSIASANAVGVATGRGGSTSRCRARMLSTTSRPNSRAESASAQAASTASSPASVTAVRISTNWRSPSLWPASRRRICASAGGRSQLRNGSPLRSAPGFLASTGR